MKLEIVRVGEEECGWEEFCDFEPCLETNFGTSANALPNFSTKMSGIKTVGGTNGLAFLSRECPGLERSAQKFGFPSILAIQPFHLVCQAINAEI
ncbi:hypothetical protein AVEN_33653-1 [Araneus ventricosus]|uniref:Uncharacterized protein n=1 Tax=Araneus ventricosus TaxID=182803 RepID=A0A4Y2M4B2_ARAVE|nr:hypothetical protein AVEN_33653-1 [Araneus ventricosus]